MFGKLKKVYFGERLVDKIEELKEKSRVIVTFADDKKPKTEEMHISEWDAGNSEKPVEKPDQKQKWFVDRTQKMRQAVIDLIISFNPRFSDMKRNVDWIHEGINITYQGVVAKVFGLQNFDTEATVDLVALRLEKPGEDLTKDWKPLEKEIFALIRKEGVKVNDITSQSFFGGLQQKIENIISESVADALGGSDEARRCDDIERLLKGEPGEPKV